MNHDASPKGLLCPLRPCGGRSTVVAPLAGSAVSLVVPVQPNVSAGFRSDPTNRTMPPNSDETGAIAWLPFTKEDSANFRDFAPLIYLAFGIAGFAYG